jgi:hypothetical protein
MQTENTNELAAALAKAQGAMENAKFDRTNPHFRNRYASLAAVVDAIRKPLSDNGLSYTQTTEIRENGFVLVTTLRHSSGQWIASEYPLPMAKGGTKDDGIKPQELGSALSYARRYSLSALACISSEEDDDAEGSQQNGQTNSKPAPKSLKTVQLDPPVNPETGEMGPHLIVEPDNMKWSAYFVAAIRAAKSDAEIKAWKDVCDERLKAIAELGPNGQKTYDRMMEVIEIRSAELKRSAA